MTVKIERLCKKLFADEGVTLVEWRNHQGHFKATLARPDGHRTTLTIAGSPKVPEQTVRAVGREARQFLNQEKA